jgi:hypothetical protein
MDLRCDFGYIFMLRTLIHFYHILSPQP